MLSLRYCADFEVTTDLFGSSNFICSQYYAPVLFSGVGSLFLLFGLLFSQPIQFSLLIHVGAWWPGFCF